MSRFSLFSAFFLTVLSLLNACATSSAQFAPAHFGQVYPPRTPAVQIELFRSSAPNKKFIEIGAVNACCSTDMNHLINELRIKASESGGDALMGLDYNANGGTSATVIRYE